MFTFLWIIGALFILLVILFSYSQQWNDSTITSGENIVRNSNDGNERINSKCKAIVPLESEDQECPSCGTITYYKKTFTDSSSSHFVYGKQLPNGTYCIRADVPNCDQHKGFLVVDDFNNIDCVCRFPEFFDGPACNTQVACATVSGELYPLVDRDGNELDRAKNYDFYNDGIRCKCGRSVYGFKEVPLGRTNCVIDPCLYPVPFLEGGLVESSCVCVDPLSHTLPDDIYSPCSTCVYGSNILRSVVPYSTESVEQFPVPCFTKFQLLKEIYNRYPCADVDAGGGCGVTSVNVVAADDFTKGAADKLYDISYKV